MHRLAAIGILLKNKLRFCRRTYAAHVSESHPMHTFSIQLPSSEKYKKKRKKNENIFADVISLHVSLSSSIEREAIFHFFCYCTNQWI